MEKGRIAEGPLLLTVSEAAKLLRISRGLAYELVRQERIPSIRLGRRILVPRHGLEVWIAQETGLPQQAHPNRIVPAAAPLGTSYTSDWRLVVLFFPLMLSFGGNVRAVVEENGLRWPPRWLQLFLSLSAFALIGLVMLAIRAN